MSKTIRSLVLLSVSVSALATPAAAQETEIDTVEDVIVVKGFRKALADSLEQKRDANQVIDSITSEEIGLFPDQNVAEALQRITGVQITRNNGEGEQVNIRGLDATFTRVEIDGRSTNVTIDSANPERASVLSVFASDLYNSIEVIKSPTAADIEGGIGGIVRLKTPDPLDVGELRWGVDAGLTDADQRGDTEPQVTGFFTNVVADGRLGVLLSGTYEDRDRSINKIQSTNGWAAFDSDDPTQGFYPERLRFEQRVGDAQKINLSGKLAYAASDALTLKLDGVFTREEREEDRSRVQFRLDRGRGGAATVVAADNTALAGAFSSRVRTEPRSFTRLADVETYGITGGFEYETDIWAIDADASISSSEEDFTEYRAQARFDEALSYSIEADPQYPVVSIDFPTDDNIGFQALNLQQRVISIEEQAYQLNAKRFIDTPFFDSVKAGARYSVTEFDRQQGAIDATEPGSLTFADGQPFVVDGTFAEDFAPAGLLQVWPSVDPEALYNQFPANGDFVFNDENLYNIEESVLAGYVMTDFSSDKMFGRYYGRGNIGVRVVNTNYDGVGRVNLQEVPQEIIDQLPADTLFDASNEVLVDGGSTLSRDYTEVLPSFNLVMAKEEGSKLQFRAAAYRALARPTLNEIQPGIEVNFDDGDYVTGNPDLNPYTAWNYDLGVEYYFGEGAITATYFYKDVQDFIAQNMFDQTFALGDLGLGGVTGDPVDFQVSTFQNGGDASISGVEIGLQTPFTFLPGRLSNFGFYGNYTYTDSEFTDADGNSFSFPGASEQAYNAVAYYEEGGFSTRLAYSYRDEFLVVPSAQNAEFGDEQGRLDIAARYRFDNGLRISFDALNLTEEQDYNYYDTPNRLSTLDAEGRIFSIRIGYIH